MACEIQKSRAKAFDAGQGADGSVIVRAARTADIHQFFNTASSAHDAVLVAERAGALVGFVELSLRASADGCDSSPVARLESWFVAPEARGTGVGPALLRAAEDWGRSQGCAEFVSDAAVENL